MNDGFISHSLLLGIHLRGGVPGLRTKEFSTERVSGCPF